MGILSGLFRFFKKLLRAVLKFIKKYWVFIIIFAVALTIAFPGIWAAIGTQLGALGSSIWAGATSLYGWYASLFTGLSFWEGAALAIGTAFLLAPEATGEVIKDAAGVVGDVVGEVGGSILDTVFSSPILIIGLGVAAFWLLSGDGGDSKTVYVENARPDVKGIDTQKARKPRSLVGQGGFSGKSSSLAIE